MAKSKPSGPQHYEILFIITNRFTEDEASASVERVKKILEGMGGQITLEEFWGKKRLAYPIKGEHYGYYQLYEFDLERNELAKLEEKLRLDSEVVRFMVVKKKIKSEEEIKKAEKIKAKITKKVEEEEKAKAKKASGLKTKEEKKKTDLNSLDEKLEGILNAKDLI